MFRNTASLFALIDVKLLLFVVFQGKIVSLMRTYHLSLTTYENQITFDGLAAGCNRSQCSDCLS